MNPERLSVTISGAVQGVGFRPFVFRLAREFELCGWVRNDGRGVALEVEGERTVLEGFLDRLQAETPPRARVLELNREWLRPVGHTGFTIQASGEGVGETIVVLADLATCPACLTEVLDAADRRYRYPFTNCTDCGPRFSIVETVPYDRPNTTMQRFNMCPACNEEYGEPLDRRFHAQPNACPRCGPSLQSVDGRGKVLSEGDGALAAAVEGLRDGQIVAVKGLGGFLLMADATQSAAVAELRSRKQREEKPLALMVKDVAAARDLCAVSVDEERVLASPESPIVLLRRRPGAAVAEAVAPGNPYLGVMLPCTPLHHLLSRGSGVPLVATSGNVTDEPICIGNHEALQRLGTIADRFLLHNRPIARQVDDSVVRWTRAGLQPLRRSRGYAPMPVVVPRLQPGLLAVGGHLKNTVALSMRGQAVLSQHLGDLDTPQGRDLFADTIADLLRLYDVEPHVLARDLHPDYPSSLWVEEAVRTQRGVSGEDWRQRLRGLPVIAVQHHHAHLASCLADNGIEGPALGVIWDGTGYGDDGTVWGGEFLLGDRTGYRRVASLRPFRLPGGEAAVREPRRSAVGLLWEVFGGEWLAEENSGLSETFGGGELKALATMLERGFNAPVTTSAGRLFDAVAALAGVRQTASFEGQAAMELEHLIDRDEQGSYSLPVVSTGAERGEEVPQWRLDWRPMVEEVLVDSRRGRQAGMIAARFHNALTDAIAAVAERIGESKIVLSGGCFQNVWLSERVAERLSEMGFEVIQHRNIPANDGGLSLGQLAVAAGRVSGRRDSR